MTAYEPSKWLSYDRCDQIARGYVSVDVSFHYETGRVSPLGVPDPSY